MTAKVRRWSTIRVVNRSYSVPARLIGERVRVLLHHDHLEVYFAGKLAERLPRIRGQRPARIDYHHVIWSLARKPGAFARYRWREELFPSLIFRRAYDLLRSFHGELADSEYVPIPHMAASSGEAVVERSLRELLEGVERFDAVAGRSHDAAMSFNAGSTGQPVALSILLELAVLTVVRGGPGNTFSFPSAKETSFLAPYFP